MGAFRIALVLTVALAAAIVLALVVRGVMGGKRPAPAIAEAPTKPMARVLVARHDMKVGDRIGGADLGWQPWPPEAVNPSYITNGAARPAATGAAAVAEGATQALEAVAQTDSAIQGLQNSIVRQPIMANEPIDQRKLVRGGEGGYMAVVLQPGMRGMSIPVTVQSAAGGFILPNDRVDVVLNQKVTVEGKETQANVTISRVIMRNLRVLAIDQTTEAPRGAHTLIGAVATLEVPAGDVEGLARAKTQGDLVLALRSYADTGGATGGVISSEATGGAVKIYRNGVQGVGVNP